MSGKPHEVVDPDGITRRCGCLYPNTHGSRLIPPDPKVAEAREALALLSDEQVVELWEKLRTLPTAPAPEACHVFFKDASGEHGHCVLPRGHDAHKLRP